MQILAGFGSFLIVWLLMVATWPSLARWTSATLLAHSDALEDWREAFAFHFARHARNLRLLREGPINEKADPEEAR